MAATPSAVREEPSGQVVYLPDLHPEQNIIARDLSRYRVVAAGRRYGKTVLGVIECIRCAVHGGRAWWVTPDYPRASVGWRNLKLLTASIPGVVIRESDRMVLFPGGGWAQVKSADSPDSLRGEGLDLLVLDECAYISEDAWTSALRPTLSDRQGRALFISSPSGRNWFHRLWIRGQDPLQPDWQSWRYKTVDNPHILPEEVEAARADMTENEFKQEYLAEFLEDEGAVFRGVRECIAGKAAEPVTGKAYVLGTDLGRHHDFTVLSVLDTAANQLVFFDRFSRVDWNLQLGRIAELAKRYNSAIAIVDATGLGSPIVEQLQRMDVSVHPFTFTAASKKDLIDNLAVAVEQQAIRFPQIDVLVNELEAYQYTRSKAGALTMNAPEGQHDDCVVSLALAWHGRKYAGALDRRVVKPHEHRYSDGRSVVKPFGR